MIKIFKVFKNQFSEKILLPFAVRSKLMWTSRDTTAELSKTWLKVEINVTISLTYKST